MTGTVEAHRIRTAAPDFLGDSAAQYGHRTAQKYSNKRLTPLAVAHVRTRAHQGGKHNGPGPLVVRIEVVLVSRQSRFSEREAGASRPPAHCGSGGLTRAKRSVTPWAPFARVSPPERCGAL
ncbi:hypothetical protein GCM10023085_53880 [Actinomadura viridis]